MAYARLLTNPEATYKNYFRNIYATYGMAKDNSIHNLSKKIKSGYVPEQSFKVYVPKPNGLNRMYTLMGVEDQIVYQAYANKLADQMQVDSIKRRYKETVFGNLYAGKKSDFFFQRWEDSYKAFTKAIIKAYKNGNEYIASFDLTACYDSINHNLLEDILRKFHFAEACIKQLITLLEKWCSPSSDHLIGVGIPQGPQASGIIAESVLSEYDSFVESLKKSYDFKYFRYVDDIKILAKEEETVNWILFLLDKKSKELGLFPQASKVSIHKIINIDDEVKRISKPLFEDDIEEKLKPDVASKNIKEMLQANLTDITTVKRYLQYVEPNSNNNKLVFKILEQHPETITSFVYYVRRYPRKLPSTIVEFIKKCMLDKTKQYQAGILLQVATFNMTSNAVKELGNIADSLLRKDRKEQFIFDLLFKEQLYLLLILSGKFTVITYVKKIKREENWWIRQQLLSDLIVCDAPEEITKKLVSISLISEHTDETLGAAMQVVVEPTKYIIPPRNNISSPAQEALKQAGIIKRGKYSNSQINKYLEMITGEKWSFRWKHYLRNEHDNVERFIFAATSYWRTDLTAFVNLWDTIDDRMLSVITATHTELGGYTLGKIGGIKDSRRMHAYVPLFHKMVMDIHDMRLHSFLSHSKVKATGEYTGPIPYRDKGKIQRLIIDGMRELEGFW